MSAAVTSERHGSVGIVRLDDGRFNVLGLDVVEALRQALLDASSNAAVVLLGRDGCLSAGLDRSVMFGGTRDARAQLLRAMTELYETMMELAAPLVVACTGHAIAGGAVLLLAADHRIGAAGPGRIGLTEVTVGLPLPPLAVALARARLSPNHLARATTGGEYFDPEQAVMCGYLDELRPAAELEACAVDRASHLGELRAEAFLATRALFWAPVKAEVDAARARSRAARS